MASANYLFAYMYIYSYILAIMKHAVTMSSFPKNLSGLKI